MEDTPRILAASFTLKVSRGNGPLAGAVSINFCGTSSIPKTMKGNNLLATDQEKLFRIAWGIKRIRRNSLPYSSTSFLSISVS